MPVLLLAVMWRLESITWGLIAGAVILYSLLIHEIAHVLTARALGGDIDEVIIWPLGGLGPVEPGHRLAAPFWISLAGPAANLLVAMLCVYPLSLSGQLQSLLNPLNGFELVPAAAMTAGLSGSQLTTGAVWPQSEIVTAVLRMTFLVNWGLVLLNLLPVSPVDGGQMLRWFLSLRFSDPEARDFMLRLGLVAGLIGLIGGFIVDESSVTALSAIILIVHLQEGARRTELQSTRVRETSFLGYDFSAGYTSLAASSSDWPEPDTDENAIGTAGEGLLERWRARRDEERMRREEEDRQREEEQVDVILEKLHLSGRSALSSAELRLLAQFSERLRQRNART
ncbi:MAG: metalloprotease [Planctomyces sp.]